MKRCQGVHNGVCANMVRGGVWLQSICLAGLD
jgi:hypothetical protein